MTAYCGRCARIQAIISGEICIECGRVVWEVRALAWRERYPPSGVFRARQVKPKRVTAGAQEIACTDTSVKRHLRKHRPDF